MSLTFRAKRLNTLSFHLTTLNSTLADDVLQSLFEERDGVAKIRRTSEEIQTSTFPPGLLAGTGSDSWRELWEAAKRFSTKAAYSDTEFPVAGVGARCVLCQQELGGDACVRLKRFEEGVRSAVQQEVDKKKKNYEEHVNRLADLTICNEAVHVALEELRLETEELTRCVESDLEQAEFRQQKVLKTLREDQPFPQELPRQQLHTDEISMEARLLQDRADQLLQNNTQEARVNLSNELRELEAREVLGKQQKVVLDEIVKKQKLAAYQMCLQDTTTTSITRKSIDVTTRAVTDKLVTSFQDELRKLRFTHLEIEMREAGGARGVLYHKLVLKRASGVDLPRILSEGEARCLSIAAFFSELSTASDQSAILFDDPVSSLDHEWRENVAYRLVEEAKTRQVIVFTHDIVFLIALDKLAEEVGVACQHQHLRKEAVAVGISSPEFPWVGMKVRDRVGVLRNMWQRAEKLYRTASREVYEQEARLIYGRLREAWERGLEEILLGGVVERYRPSIQTQQTKYLSDITDNDCKGLETSMTKCSRWLAGHDQAPAENIPVPNPVEIRNDIDALDTWIKTISRRRKK